MNIIEIAHQPWAQVVLQVIVAIAVVWCGFKLYQIARYKKNAYAALNAGIGILVAFYFIGVISKVGEFGPEFVRYHLGDIGFPVATAGILLSISQLRAGPTSRSMSDLERFTYHRDQASGWMKFIVIGLVLAYAYEIVVPAILYGIADQKGITENLPVGNFDWLDMLAYTLGATLGFICAFLLKRRMQSGVDAHLELAQAQKAHKAALSAQQPKKYKKTRKRRGVR
jgi:hypothetical protein